MKVLGKVLHVANLAIGGWHLQGFDLRFIE
ncbi:Uncharacterised protein [Mycobacteroides abscessus subsp. abscessus]|nr:Uncharacterised protein [Mycobacteroides abscessus subsp. abscessus]